MDAFVLPSRYEGLPVVGVGAPVHIFLPRVAELLGTRAVVRESASVANALGAIASKTDSQAPVVSYATAYPVALILMTIIAKVIIQTIGGVVGNNLRQALDFLPLGKKLVTVVCDLPHRKATLALPAGSEVLVGVETSQIRFINV